MAMLAAGTTTAQADPPGDLEEGDVIYMVLTDRFFDGDNTNNDLSEDNYDPDDLAMYHGGDWEGLTD